MQIKKTQGLMYEQANRLTGVHVTPTVLFNVSLAEFGAVVLDNADNPRVSLKEASPAASARTTGSSGSRRISRRDEGRNTKLGSEGNPTRKGDLDFCPLGN